MKYILLILIINFSAYSFDTIDIKGFINFCPQETEVEEFRNQSMPSSVEVRCGDPARRDAMILTFMDLPSGIFLKTMSRSGGISAVYSYNNISHRLEKINLEINDRKIECRINNTTNVPKFSSNGTEEDTQLCLDEYMQVLIATEFTSKFSRTCDPDYLNASCFNEGTNSFNHPDPRVKDYELMKEVQKIEDQVDIYGRRPPANTGAPK